MMTEPIAALLGLSGILADYFTYFKAGTALSAARVFTPS
jgi:hypothetical protein